MNRLAVLSLASAAVVLGAVVVPPFAPGAPPARAEDGLGVFSGVHSFHADRFRRAPNRGGVIYQTEVSLVGAGFLRPPLIFLSVVQAEFKGDRAEYYVTPTDVGPSSFTLQVWGADRMRYGEFSVQWLAIGPSAAPDLGPLDFLPWPPDIVD